MTVTLEFITTEHVWLAFGLFGQALFFMRFLVQWLMSERQGESVMPVAFWYFSIGGGVTLLAYAIYRCDPVFIPGQALGILVYLRNLYFIHGNRFSFKAARLPRKTSPC